MRKLNSKELESIKGGAMNCFLANIAIALGQLSHSDALYWKNKCK